MIKPQSLSGIPLAILSTLLLSYSSSAESLPLTTQIDRLKLSVCLQNWNAALSATNLIIGSEELKNDDRSFYVEYRHTIEGYIQSKAHFDQIPGCEAILKAAAPVSPSASISSPTAPTVAPQTPPPAQSNFNWNAAIAKIPQGTTAAPTGDRVPAESPPQGTVSPTNPSPSSPPRIQLTENQGVFFRPAPSSNIPQQRINGSLMSTLPLTADGITVYYDVYRSSTPNTVNASTRYTCNSTQSFTMADPLPAKAQKSVSIAEPNAFVQVVGITWRENGNSAFVRVSDFPASETVQPCGSWSGYGDRQAVDPQIRLR